MVFIDFVRRRQPRLVGCSANAYCQLLPSTRTLSSCTVSRRRRTALVTCAPHSTTRYTTSQNRDNRFFFFLRLINDRRRRRRLLDAERSARHFAPITAPRSRWPPTTDTAVCARTVLAVVTPAVRYSFAVCKRKTRAHVERGVPVCPEKSLFASTTIHKPEVKVRPHAHRSRRVSRRGTPERRTAVTPRHRHHVGRTVPREKVSRTVFLYTK